MSGMYYSNLMLKGLIIYMHLNHMCSVNINFDVQGCINFDINL